MGCGGPFSWQIDPFRGPCAPLYVPLLSQFTSSFFPSTFSLTLQKTLSNIIYYYTSIRVTQMPSFLTHASHHTQNYVTMTIIIIMILIPFFAFLFLFLFLLERTITHDDHGKSYVSWCKGIKESIIAFL